ncbi:MAG: YchJ family metal-binding protein [Solirubrobacteraceae bacterium]|nr:YchJ family metal-binding protein [Patulibacter sp.]
MSDYPDSKRCPCGSGQTYGECCGPLHRGRASGSPTAPTAERLMRSRYSAFAVGDGDYLDATWHRSTREDLQADEVLEWRRLDVLHATAGGPDDDTGTVRFVAHYWDPSIGEFGEVAELSAFVRERGQWFYTGPADERSGLLR